MLRFTRFTNGTGPLFSTLTLPLEQRIRSRLRVILDNGENAGLFLPRGSMMKQGDRLQAESGQVVEIQAAPELVSTIRVEDPLLMSRACYHLGNRHVPLQIGDGLLRYQHDHVLDEMCRGLGLIVSTEQAPFEPESGAYGEQASSHGHHHH